MFKLPHQSFQILKAEICFHKMTVKVTAGINMADHLKKSVLAKIFTPWHDEKVRLLNLNPFQWSFKSMFLQGWGKSKRWLLNMDLKEH